MLQAIMTRLLLLALLPVALGISIDYTQDLPSGAGIENIALRSNGDALLTDNFQPYLFQVAPVKGAAPKLIHKFSGTHGASGIAPSSKPDEFFIVTGNYSFQTLGPVPGTYAIHHLVFDEQDRAIVTELSPLGIAQPNGMIHVPHTPYVLIADSYGGFIWKFNTETLQLRIYFDHPALKPLLSEQLLFGVDGIKLSQKHLYFSNTNQQFIAILPATGKEEQLHGDPQIVATDTPADDFILQSNGDIYIAQQVPSNSLGYISHKRYGAKPETLAGGPDSDAVSGCTAVTFAKGTYGHRYGRTLLVPVNGNVTAIFGGDTSQRAKLAIIQLDED